ncbi:uncharacterized protein LOC128223245 [Mya arenaria]|uniref:uncharacterized protein LOC128223245 n=1 Tax=Mya arenaria TaxID=6604 RepID=UPI0022E90C94|nr:uncharacterized protein LOC128223245 [Mya arenaria]
MAEAENLENEKEYFTRVHLALTECGTEVLCKLLLKKVKDLTPLDHPSIPWSLDEFLHYKKKDILSAIGKEKSKEDTLYPFRRDTDLEKWDISLFVHVILTACDLDANDQLHRQLKNDICNLRNLRNKIAHKQTHKLTETIYQSYYGRLQGSILRICEFIQEPDLQDSFEKKLNKYEYLGHVYANGLITDDNNKTEEVINEGDGTVESGLQQIKSIIQQKSLTVNIPVLDVMLMFRNYNKDDEQAVSERLHQLFSEALEKENIFETDDKHECVDFRAKLRNEVLSLVRKLFQEKRTIAKVSTGCLVLTIHCPDLDNVISFIQDSISGRLTELFSSLEEVMRTETSNESFDVYAGITKQSCWSLLNTLFCDVSKACHHSRFLIESIRQNEGVSIRILNFLENIQEKEHTADYIASNQTDEIRLQLSENLEQYIYQSGLEMDLFIQGKYEKSNVKESPVQELCYYEQNPTGPDKIPRVRRSSSVSCIFSNKNEDLREEVDSLEGIGSNGVQKWLDDFETHRREGNAIRSNLLESLDVTHDYTMTSI